MNKILKIAIGSYIAMILTGCKDLYYPPDSAKDVRSLVVEGLLNSGQAPTVIRLSRTVNLNDTAKIKYELGAQVTVEGENGSKFTLTGNTKGEYSIVQLSLDGNVKYRVRIRTTDSKEYLSDFVPVQTAPPIDNIVWKRKEDGLQPGIQIFLNSHDDQNKTKYYRWEYDETWEFHSPYPSYYEYVNGLFIPRPDPTKLWMCWRSEPSNTILVGSSAQLAQDVISLAPITLVPFGSIKMTVRYSILVRQYALTKEAYDYWDILRKNTEQVGTLFDPQPSHLKSNIHCTSVPDEQVIGFISAGTITEKRIFITNDEVRPWNYFHNCGDETEVFPMDYVGFFGSHTLIPTRAHTVMGVAISYYGSYPSCVDCTLSGTNVKPSFW
jgi:hypothetical protein